MKVRVTFDISDKDRLLFGAKIHGKLVPATNEEVTNIIEVIVEESLALDRKVFDEHTAEIIKAIRHSLDKEK
jgi:hypothetical protein